MGLNEALLNLTIETAETFILEPELVLAVMKAESNFDIYSSMWEDNVNDWSVGIMQVRYETAKLNGFKGTLEELYQPEENIFYGCKVLKDCTGKYSDLTLAIASYNSGKPIYITKEYLEALKTKISVQTDPALKTAMQTKYNNYSKRIGTLINQPYVDKILKYYNEYKSNGVSTNSINMGTVTMAVIFGGMSIWLFNKYKG